MRPAEIIDSRYRLERLLGTGGMAEVWLAEDQRLGRWVALKILREESAGQEGELISSFRREARIIARLQHPNIVQVYDAGVHEGRNYLVMEYIHGYSLRALIQAQHRLDEAEAVGYATQIAAALQYAHDQGVVHCDIKPENVLISENHVPKLADFGVAETLTRTLAPGEAQALLGTIGYLAPEVIQGEPADARTDVYSLALTLYEMLAGRLPWAGSNPAAVAGQRLATPAPPVRAFNRAVSAEVEAVLARALSLGQDHRFQSAGEFGAALKRASNERAGVAAAGAVVAAGAAGAPATRAASRPPATSPSPAPRRATAASRPDPRRKNGGSAAGVAIGIAVALLLAGAAGVAGAFFISRGNGDDTSPTPTATRPAVIATTPTATATVTPTPRPTNEPTLTPTAATTPTPTRPATPSVTPGTPTPTARPSGTPTTRPISPTPTATPVTGERLSIGPAGPTFTENQPPAGDGQP